MTKRKEKLKLRTETIKDKLVVTIQDSRSDIKSKKLKIIFRPYFMQSRRITVRFTNHRSALCTNNIEVHVLFKPGNRTGLILLLDKNNVPNTERIEAVAHLIPVLD